jgi:hypothetical protein
LPRRGGADTRSMVSTISQSETLLRHLAILTRSAPLIADLMDHRCARNLMRVLRRHLGNPSVSEAIVAAGLPRHVKWRRKAASTHPKLKPYPPRILAVDKRLSDSLTVSYYTIICGLPRSTRQVCLPLASYPSCRPRRCFSPSLQSQSEGSCAAAISDEPQPAFRNHA